MSRKSPGRQSDQVESEVELSQGRSALGQGTARQQQSLPLNRRDRLQSLFDGTATLHLDDTEKTAAPRQQIDLTLARAESKAKDLVTLRHQEQRRDHLRRAAFFATDTPALAARGFHARPCSSSARR